MECRLETCCLSWCWARWRWCWPPSALPRKISPTSWRDDIEAVLLANFPLPSVQLVLLALWAALLFGGFALGGTSPDRSRRMPAWTRLGSSLTLVAIAWLDFALTRELPVAGYALLIALGMSFGFLGDLCLAGVLPVFSQPVAGG